MLEQIRIKLSFANVVSVVALFVALGGSAYAVTQLDRNSVKSKHIVDGQVRGVDVDEATLEGVNAASVGGLQVRRINYSVPDDDASPYATVLNFGGLVITAACRTFGDGLDVKATTTKDNANMFVGSIGFGQGSYGPQFLVREDWDVVDTFPELNIDNLFVDGEYSMGTLHYQAPDGSAVMVDLKLHENFDDDAGCDVTGVAIGP